MEDDFRRYRVAILGTGLIGGSLALALRGRVGGLYLYDPDPRTRVLARSWGLGDVVDRPEDALRHANVVLLAAPVRAIEEWLYRLPRLMPQPAIVMDVGSTKAAVCRAMGSLPPRFDPIGGHPIAGKEKAGLAHAQADLFRGAAFVLTPLARTGPRARAFAEALVRLLEARPVWMDPETHDRLLAFTSHMPYLLSLALALSLPEEAQEVVGPGWRSMTRLAASSHQMMLDILMTNLEPVLEALEQVQDVLELFRQALLRGEEAQLRAWMERVRSGRAQEPMY